MCVIFYISLADLQIGLLILGLFTRNLAASHPAAAPPAWPQWSMFLLP